MSDLRSLLNELEWQDEVPDADLKIRGGGRSSRPLDKGGRGRGEGEGGVFKNLFSVWSKNKSGGRVPWAPPLDPPLGHYLITMAVTCGVFFILKDTIL